MKKLSLLFILFILFVLNASAQELLFDGTETTQTTTVSPENSAIKSPEITRLFNEQVLPKAQKHWKGEASCDQDFKIEDAAAGWFTKQGAKQKAYLYTYCGEPYDESYQGIVILENNQIIAHYVFSSEYLFHDSIDNREGLILLSGSGTKMQSDWGALSILKVDPADMSLQIQMEDYYYENYCNIEGRNCTLTAKKYYFQSGGDYTFWAESYQKKGKAWIQLKPKKVVSGRVSEKEVVIGLTRIE